ncbi:MAG: ATP-binding cassette domain-containing protein, partial [Fusobacterium sp.]|nr:ATP-binding cassette domain-containing protein [Fusobacterium sp.]
YDIELENVSFSYNKDENILKDVSFLAKQGEVTALVGISGCGKTSILKLVSRLYDYDRGTIKIGDKDIKKISTKNLFEKISIVFQDVILFNNSILENIRLGRPDATDEEVLKAAELANCNDFIKKMPNSYNTLIGENGVALSGGERQRLSIARAFLKNAPIILVDEISASIDVENEKKIQESLNKLLKNKTALIISHRLKSIENVDKIVVINDGKVEAVGKHKDLLRKSQTYLNLIEKSLLSENFKY